MILWFVAWCPWLVGGHGPWLGGLAGLCYLVLRYSLHGGVTCLNEPCLLSKWVLTALALAVDLLSLEEPSKKNDVNY